MSVVLDWLFDNLAAALPRRSAKGYPSSWPTCCTKIVEVLKSRVAVVTVTDDDAFAHALLFQETMLSGIGDCAPHFAFGNAAVEGRGSFGRPSGFQNIVHRFKG